MEQRLPGRDSLRHKPPQVNDQEKCEYGHHGQDARLLERAIYTRDLDVVVVDPGFDRSRPRKQVFAHYQLTPTNYSNAQHQDAHATVKLAQIASDWKKPDCIQT